MGRGGKERIAINDPPPSLLPVIAFIVFSYWEEKTTGNAKQSCGSWGAHSPALPPYCHLWGLGEEGRTQKCWLDQNVGKPYSSGALKALQSLKRYNTKKGFSPRSKCLGKILAHVWEMPPEGTFGGITWYTSSQCRCHFLLWGFWGVPIEGRARLVLTLLPHFGTMTFCKVR